MDKKEAIVVGDKGQDGVLLSKQLEEVGYKVIGLNKLNFDILSTASVMGLIDKHRPSEIYFLAAHHNSSEDKLDSDGLLFRHSFDVNVHALINFLDAIAAVSPSTRIFYASSSLIFGTPNSEVQSESTECKPETPYAISKVAGMNACRYYREARGVFASIGILYNHESHLRSPKFLSRKIVQAAIKIQRFGSGELRLGNLDNIVDWGYAPDFVDAMLRVMMLDEPGEFIIATGKGHSVKEFLILAFSELGIDYRDHVVIDSEVISRNSTVRIGDSSLLRVKTGWAPSVSFEDMVSLLVDAELQSIK